MRVSASQKDYEKFGFEASEVPKPVIQLVTTEAPVGKKSNRNKKNK